MADTRTRTRNHSPGPSTADLLARARGGDRSAENAVIQRHLPDLRRYAHGRVPPAIRAQADTEDFVQGAVMRALKHLASFDASHRGAFQIYLRTCLRNLLIDEVRRSRRKPVSELAEPELVEDHGPSPAQLAESRETVRRYRKAMAKLRPADRAMIVARVERGWPYSKMGKAFRKSDDAARVACHRALKRLAETMKAGAMRKAR